MRAWIATAALSLASLAILAASSPATAQSGWAPQPSGTFQNLNGVDFTGPAHGVAVGDAGTILRTTDGGATWSPRPSNTTYDLNAVSFGSASAGIAAGEGLTIARTTDGGVTWTVVITDFLAGLRGAHMLDAQLGFVAGVNSIFEPLVGVTTDGGGNWDFHPFRFDGAEGNLRDIHFLSPLVGVAVGYDWTGQGAIARSTNGGTSWQTVLYVSEPLYGLDFADASVGVAVGVNGRILRTTDGGASWSPEASATGQFLHGVSMPAPAAGNAVGAAGTILRTDGSGWHGQTSGTSAQLNQVAFIDSNLGWAVGDGGTILHTATGGEPPAAVPDPGAVARLVLHPGGPNPFRVAHAIEYELPVAAAVRLAVYDPAGRLVRRLADGNEGAGRHAAAWDGTDAAGARAAGGVYVLRLEAAAGGASASRTGKVVLLH